MNTFTVFFLRLLLGLVFGSFVNVLIDRTPQGESILGRSRCPKCKSKIFWYDNIPLLSYIFLKGKCRKCKRAISYLYPAIELLTAILFVLSPLPLLPYIPLLVALFFIDFQKKLLPDTLVFTGMGISFVANLLLFPDVFYAHLFFGFLAASFLLLIHLITKSRGMGLGDVKFSIFAGLLLGPLVLHYFYFAFILGAVYGIVLIILDKGKLKSEVAFGPFLITSLFLVYYGVRIPFISL